MLRVLFLILILFSSISLAQIQDKPKAVKLDDLVGIHGECDLGARLDNLRIELANDPNAKGFIITYQSVNALVFDLERSPMDRRILTQMAFGGIESERVAIIFGGYRKDITSEIWLVPKDAEPPKPTDTLPKPIIPTNSTFQFASRSIVSFEFDEPEEFLSASTRKERDKIAKESEEEDRKNGVEPTTYEDAYNFSKQELEEMKFSWAIDSFGEIIKNQTGSEGTIIFYGDSEYYNIRNVGKHIEQGKKIIAKNTNISPKQINVVYGGYRESLVADFWVIPSNGKSPNPTPEKRQVFDSEQ